MGHVGLPTPEFLAWGWRVPFWFSAVLPVVGLVVRYGVSESLLFKEAAQRATASRERPTPVRSILRRPWRMLLVAVAFAANPAISILFATFAVKIPAAHGASQSAVLGFCLKDGRREALETIG